MTQPSFKDFLKQTMLDEAIPTVWDSRAKNVVTPEDEEERMMTCPECRGDGARYGDSCPTCDGHGEIPDHDTGYNDERLHRQETGDFDWDEDEEEDSDELDSDDGVDAAGDEEDVDVDDVDGEDYDDEFDDSEDGDEQEEDEPEDLNKQGVIRKVEGAHLVYKRQDEEGVYEELWIYRLGDAIKDELKIRRSILAGTDIPEGQTRSEDGSQKYELWTSGNIQMLNVKGLPN